RDGSSVGRAAPNPPRTTSGHPPKALGPSHSETPMNLYATTVPQFKRLLQNVERWLDKTIAFADTKKFDPNTLLTARLAPDQFALVRQIQSVCDQCKLTCARITAKEPPKHPDTEQSFDELRKRLHSVIAYLDTFKPADFDGAAERLISLPFFPEGKAM